MENKNNIPQAARLDIMHSPDGDISLEGDDITYTESTGQHKADLLLADKGHYKETPVAGIGAANFINETDPEEFYRTTRKELERDGMKVKKIRITAGELQIDASYGNSNS